MRKRLTTTGVLFTALTVICAPLSVVAVDSASATPAVEGRLVNVGSHRLFCRLQGKGTPLVILEPGIAETFRTWEPITTELAKLTTVLVYDRAGYGESDAGSRPRTSTQAVAELVSLLDHVGKFPRVVLLGHSLGGVYALTFASKHPGRVAGLAVLDPPPLDFVMGREFKALREKANQFTQQFKEQAATQRKSGNERQAAFFEAVASEHGELFEGSSGREFDSIKNLGDIPLIVVSSEKFNPQMGESAEDFQRFWIQSNERLSRLSRRGKFVLATNASHHIHLDAPETVIRAVRQLVEMERHRAKAEPDGDGNGKRPIRSETNRTSSAVGSRLGIQDPGAARQ